MGSDGGSVARVKKGTGIKGLQQKFRKKETTTHLDSTPKKRTMGRKREGIEGIWKGKGGQ